MPETGSTVHNYRVRVRARGQEQYYFETLNPAFIPRVGELIAFRDRDGRVESVRWIPQPDQLDEGMRVEIECVPVAEVKVK